MPSTNLSKFLGLAAFGAAMLFSGLAPAQDTSSAVQAVRTARAALASQNHLASGFGNPVVSVYGLGTPAAIQKWYVIFYDATVSSHGRAVLVQNGQVVKTYEAQGGVTYSAGLTFDDARVTADQPVLNAAQNYAARHNIAYDSVRALLKKTSASKPLRWRIEFMDAGKSCGYVLINPTDDTIVASSSSSSSSSGNGTGSVKGDAEDFGNDVKNTFLGIGGDLQQFFTGERTVDR